MASIVPPLDFIPKLPGIGAELVSEQLNKQLDQFTQIASQTIQDSVKLPIDCKCDDPRIKKIKEQLAEVQKQISTIQENIPKIQQTINQVKQVVNTAQSIKATIAAAQLSNPVTAPLFIAQQLTAIQDATIVNAINSLSQFSTLPTQLTGRLQTLIPPLISALTKVDNACSGTGDTTSLRIPETLTDLNLDNYNDLVSSEFYNELNVSDVDLQDRSNQIESLITRQQNLLESLQEAPSQVYQEQGLPESQLGKTGDYYIDLTTSQIYGPKLTASDWGQPIN